MRKYPPNVNQVISHEQIKPKKEYLWSRVLEVLDEFPEGLTAEELAYHLGLGHRQDIAPRVSELVSQGKVHETERSRISKTTGKRATVYQKLGHWEEEQRREEDNEIKRA